MITLKVTMNFAKDRSRLILTWLRKLTTVLISFLKMHKIKIRVKRNKIVIQLWGKTQLLEREFKSFRRRLKKPRR